MKNKSLLIACAGILLYGCGGGSKESPAVTRATSPIDVSFVTRPSLGASRVVPLNGTLYSDNESIPFELDTALAVADSTTMFGGNRAIAVYSTETFRVPRLGTTEVSGSTSYFSVNGYFLGIRRDSGITCTSTDAQLGPEMLQGGESGYWYSQRCSDGSSSTSRWRAEGNGDGIDFIVSTSNLDKSLSTEERYTFDQYGNLQTISGSGTFSYRGGRINFYASG